MCHCVKNASYLGLSPSKTVGGSPCNFSDPPCPGATPGPPPGGGAPPPGGPAGNPPGNPPPGGPLGGSPGNPLSGGPPPGGGSGWSGPIARNMAASSAIILCPVSG